MKRAHIQQVESLKLQKKLLSEQLCHIQQSMSSVRAQLAEVETELGLPRTLEELCALYRSKKLRAADVSALWNKLWADPKDYITMQGMPAYNVLSGAIEEVEDCNCRIYIDLRTGAVSDAFEYMNEEHDARAREWERNRDAILAFSK